MTTVGCDFDRCDVVYKAMDLVDTPMGRENLSKLWYDMSCEFSIGNLGKDNDHQFCDLLKNYTDSSLLKSVYILNCPNFVDAISIIEIQKALMHIWAIFSLLEQSSINDDVKLLVQAVFINLIIFTELPIPEWMRMAAVLRLVTFYLNSSFAIDLVQIIAGQWGMRLLEESEHHNPKQFFRSHLFHLLMGDSYVRQRQSLKELLNSSHMYNLIKEIKQLRQSIDFYSICQKFHRFGDDLLQEGLTDIQIHQLDELISVICKRNHSDEL